ncbi:MAG: hypothetical protein J1F25_02350 [Prevotellaceae bacterium]|nr:hypothetical protein [Prevotellaceae bacterium]
MKTSSPSSPTHTSFPCTALHAPVHRTLHLRTPHSTDLHIALHEPMHRTTLRSPISSSKKSEEKD